MIQQLVLPIFLTSLHPDNTKISKDVAKGKIVALTREPKGACPLKIHWMLIIFVSLYWVLLRSYYTRVKQLIFRPAYLLQYVKLLNIWNLDS